MFDATYKSFYVVLTNQFLNENSTHLNQGYACPYVYLAASGKILVPAGRSLTNVLVVYDAKHPAPTALKQAFLRFQTTGRVSS